MKPIQYYFIMTMLAFIAMNTSDRIRLKVVFLLIAAVNLLGIITHLILGAKIP